MNRPTRVLLCDDSAVMRRLIKTAIQADPKIQVVCEAVHGQDALDKLMEVKPDVVVMDVEMPVMDGIDAVRAIRRITAKLPVIMFSSLTSRGAEATLDAIDAGATDYSTKPANAGHIKEAIAHVQAELVPKIHQWVSGVRPQPKPANPAPNPLLTMSQQVTGRSIESGSVQAVGIGVSTGGPQALSDLITLLPTDFPAPILIVQHMPPVFTKLLAERLASKKGHAVREAEDGVELRPGEILVAPGDFHMLAVRDRNTVRAVLNKEPAINSCRPAVDPLFQSMADVYGKKCLGVVLTGMGKDGTEGAKCLRESGAQVIVQDQKSSVVWGMPGSVVENGLADHILPIQQIATELVRAAEAEPAMQA